MTASHIASLFLRCIRRMPMAPSVPSPRSSHDSVAHCFAHLALHTAPSVPLLRSSHDGVAHFTRQRRSWLRFCCVANAACLLRRRSLCVACQMTASHTASILLRCKRRVPVVPLVPSLRWSHDCVAHCFASRALQTPCACGAAGPFASLVTWQRLSLRRFSCIANDVCVWRVRSLRFARHTTASLIASLLLRCNGVCQWRHQPLRFACHTTASLISTLLAHRDVHVPVALSVPLIRSLHYGVAHCFASRALQTACACGAFGPFASLVTRQRRSWLRFSCVANGVCQWRHPPLRFACHTTASLISTLLVHRDVHVPVAPSVPLIRSLHYGVAHCFASRALQTACACGAFGPFASLVTRQRRSWLRFSCVANGVRL